jgi:hypothetical protein
MLRNPDEIAPKAPLQTRTHPSRGSLRSTTLAKVSDPLFSLRFAPVLWATSFFRNLLLAISLSYPWCAAWILGRVGPLPPRNKAPLLEP